MHDPGSPWTLAVKCYVLALKCFTWKLLGLQSEIDLKSTISDQVYYVVTFTRQKIANLMFHNILFFFWNTSTEKSFKILRVKNWSNTAIRSCYVILFVLRFYLRRRAKFQTHYRYYSSCDSWQNSWWQHFLYHRFELK